MVPQPKVTQVGLRQPLTKTQMGLRVDSGRVSVLYRLGWYEGWYAEEGKR